MQATLLEPLQTPLVNKFYQLNKVRGRANKQDRIWVLKQSEIIGACRVQNRQGDLFLSTLFIAPQWRGQGLAKHLVSEIVAYFDQPIYTFAYQELQAFYQSCGFFLSADLPPELRGMFNAYQQQNRKIISMVTIGPH